MTRIGLLAATAAAAFSWSCAVSTHDGVAGDSSARRPAGSQSNRVDARRGPLKPFGSEHNLHHALAVLTEARRSALERYGPAGSVGCRAWATTDTVIGVQCGSPLVQTSTSTTTGPAPEAITNVQHAGVDEGGIVKRVDDVLVVLRRGRLFTIDTAANRLEAVDELDLSGPSQGGNEPVHAWYDELLVADRTVVVIGFSSDRGGTEIARFDLTAKGRLRHRSTHHLKSDDYYSRTNYASRLIGKTLLLYTTYEVPDDAGRLDWLPALREWQPGARSGRFERMAAISRIFGPAGPLGLDSVVHTLVTCDLAAPRLACAASVLLAAAPTVTYTSPSAIYSWTTSRNFGQPASSILYRIPFDGRPISAIAVHGTPPDHLSFLESADAHLNVVVSDSSERVELLRVPIGSFSDGTIDAPPSAYRLLADDLGRWAIARFVGPYVLVAGLGENDRGDSRRVIAARWQGSAAFSLPLSHHVERIEPMGTDAVAVGAEAGDLHVTALRLSAVPSIAGRLVQENALQTDQRSHAFFYRADAFSRGLFGLPVASTIRDAAGEPQESSSVAFIVNEGLRLTPGGRLAAGPVASQDDHCVVSCTDWYGNARPIFMNGRIFALLGYEIVEGGLMRGQVVETRRMDFTPRGTVGH